MDANNNTVRDTKTSYGRKKNHFCRVKNDDRLTTSILNTSCRSLRIKKGSQPASTNTQSASYCIRLLMTRQTWKCTEEPTRTQSNSRFDCIQFPAHNNAKNERDRKKVNTLTHKSDEATKMQCINEKRTERTECVLTYHTHTHANTFIVYISNFCVRYIES